MVKDTSLFSSLDSAHEKNFFVADDFALDIAGHGNIICRHDWIVDMFHVPSLSANMLFVSQLTQVRKIVELWHDRIFIKNLKGRSIIADGLLNPKDWCISFVTYPNQNLSQRLWLPRTTSVVEFGVKDSDTWIFVVSSWWWLRTWLLVYQRYFHLMEFVEVLYLESIIRHPSILGMHGMCRTSWSWFTAIFVASISLLSKCKVCFNIHW